MTEMKKVLFAEGIDNTDEFSAGEHEMIRSVYGTCDDKELRMLLTSQLPYDKVELDVVFGRKPLKYVGIPENEKKALFELLFPFVDMPAMDDEMLNIHCDKKFKFGDAMIIYEPWNGYNYLVSPYYAESGGMVVDIVKESKEDDNNWFDVKNVKAGDETCTR